MKKLRLLSGIILSVLCFYLILNRIDLSSLKENFGKINIPKALFSNIGLIICQWLRGQRWARLLKPLYPVTFLKSFQIYSIGNLVNLLIPLRGGDVLRAWIMANHTNLSKSSIIATVVTERLADLIFFGFILGVSLLLYPLPRWIMLIGGGLSLASFLIALLLYMIKNNASLFDKIKIGLKNYLPLFLTSRFGFISRKFFKGIAPLGSLKEYNFFIFETINLWAAQGIFIYFLFDAFHFTETYYLGAAASLLMLSLTTVAITVPSSPSYAGPLHLMTVLALEICDVPSTEALSYAIMFHGLITLNTIILGIYGLVGMHLKFQNLWSVK